MQNRHAISLDAKAFNFENRGGTHSGTTVRGAAPRRETLILNQRRNALRNDRPRDHWQYSASQFRPTEREPALEEIVAPAGRTSGAQSRLFEVEFVFDLVEQFLGYLAVAALA